MAKYDHDDLMSRAPAHIAEPVILKPDGTPAEYRPTLPPVAHDPLNMRDHEPNLRALYPKLDDLAAVQAQSWGKLVPDPVERALRRELNDLGGTAATALDDLQKLMRDQHTVQARFNDAYSQIELILSKHPELLKP